MNHPESIWAQELNRQELYDSCWIMGNSSLIDRILRDNPYYSLLPLRFYNSGKWSYKENYDLHSVGTYRDGFELRRSSEISPSLAYFAQKLWEKAAETTYRKFPQIEECSFDKQDSDGIYPIVFRYDIDEVAQYQENEMRRLIDNGFSIDEHLSIEYNEDRWRKTWHYSGVVGESSAEISQMFYNTPHGEMLPVNSRKNVSYSYEECKPYYKTFSKRMLTIGNQRRAYSFFSKQNEPLFHAAHEKNSERLKELVHQGYSLNEINTDGDTVFSVFVNAVTNEQDLTEQGENTLNEFVNLGANINLFGVSVICEPLLFTAYLCHQHRLFEWLLTNGADIDLEIGYDEELFDRSYTINDWVNEHENDHDD